jgi:hypothetical protein
LKYKTVLLSMLISAFLCSAVMAVDLDLNKFMPVDQIKPGMKGIGKTVFTGTKIEEFQIEVLEVEKNFMPKSDIIYVLCSGKYVDEAGVISGMSGSPVYIDGKLIGAIAYRMGSFVKRPIAGVTPIAQMLKIMEESEKDNSMGYGTMQDFDFSFLAKNDNETSQNVDSTMRSIEPISMPIAIGGFSQGTIKYLSPMLKRLNMTPTQGGGVSTQSNLEDVKLEPGSVIVVEFVRGDVNVNGSGTVTYVDGNKFLAFGHPMYGMGKTSLPASIGRITILIPSMLASTKQASPVKAIGAIIEDSTHGILIDITKKASFIPIKVQIKSQKGVQEYNFEVVKHRLFAPTFIASAVYDIISTATKAMGDYTMKTHSEISIKGYPKLILDDVFSGMDPDVVANQFGAPINALMQNRFEEADIDSITLDIAFNDKRTNASIDDIRINKNIVKPGDSIKVTASITPYMQDTIIKQFDVVIPKDMPEGRASLRILDATASSAWDRARAPLKARVADLGQIIKLIQEDESNSDIIIELVSPKMGVTIKGEELPALPLTALSVISSTKQVGTSGPTLGTTFSRQKVHTDYVISGNASMSLIIDREAP